MVIDLVSLWRGIDSSSAKIFEKKNKYWGKRNPYFRKNMSLEKEIRNTCIETIQTYQPPPTMWNQTKKISLKDTKFFYGILQ